MKRVTIRIHLAGLAFASLLVLTAGVASPPSAPELATSDDYVPGELLVKFFDGAPSGSVDGLMKSLAAREVREIPGIRVRHWRLGRAYRSIRPSRLCRNTLRSTRSSTQSPTTFIAQTCCRTTRSGPKPGASTTSARPGAPATPTSTLRTPGGRTPTARPLSSPSSIRALISPTPISRETSTPSTGTTSSTTTVTPPTTTGTAPTSRGPSAPSETTGRASSASAGT